MLGRVLNTVLIPLWLVLIAVVFALAIACRIVGYVRDLLEVVGGFIADMTKLAIEAIQKL